jgi:hypothetical protein
VYGGVSGGAEVNNAASERRSRKQRRVCARGPTRAENSARRGRIERARTALLSSCIYFVVVELSVFSQQPLG